MPYVIAAIILIILGAIFFFDQDKEETPIISESVTEEISETTHENDLVNNEAEQVDEKIIEEVVEKEIIITKEEVVAITPAFEFTNGEYTSQTKYLTPQRTEYSVKVTLSVDKDMITAANVIYGQGAEKDPNAQRFEAVYKNLVVGKSLDEVELSRVGGASLTTGAFNEALDVIKANAKS